MKHILLMLMMVVSSSVLWAVPARKGWITVQQSDGTSMRVMIHGNEYFHYLTNEDGDWVELNANGMYEVVPALTEQEIAQQYSNAVRKHSQETQTGIPLNIAPRGLVILVSFKDVKFTTPKDTIDSMLNGNHFTRSYSYTYNSVQYDVEAEGSARQFFEASSYGKYSPKFDVVGPVVVDSSANYYGRNTPYKDANAKKMIEQACKLANDQGVDFSQYDNNKDGNVDFVYVIYAGYGESDGGGDNTIWPHSSSLSSRPKYDGKYIYKYACGSELNYFSKVYYGVGVFCHEFGHVLGLPDFYSSANHKTLTYWDIMDQGSYANDANTPPAYSAYERFYMGWLTPRQITTPENIRLYDLQDSAQALLISPNGTHNLKGNDPYPTTFYILENRQQKGWYAACPGEGMLITKVQYNYSTWAGNYVNSDASSMGVDIIEADGKAPEYPDTGWYGKEGDCFPTGATRYLGIDNYDITYIRDVDGVIEFKFMGGQTPTENTKMDTSNIEDGKIWQNEQLIIIRNGKKYNIFGQLIQ